jgi:hypothetical protein
VKRAIHWLSFMLSLSAASWLPARVGAEDVPTDAVSPRDQLPDGGRAERERSERARAEQAQQAQEERADEQRTEDDRSADERAEEQREEQREQGEPATIVPEIVEELPQSVQDAVERMVEAREPPHRMLKSIFDLPRTRFGSGTSWLPDASPLYAVVPTAGRWGFLIGANLFTGYVWYDTKRGDQRFLGRNALNFGVFRTFRKSEVQARLSLSFEPLTVGKKGYPLLLQTGQTRNGGRLADRQYPLDFFRELALSYSWEISKSWAGSIYAALSGEPALGPVSFTNRVSASADPIAPIGLQWQENSHASYGVLTIGAFTRTLRLEASWFNGEVPKERPYSLALRKPDSYSFRAAYNPRPELSLQASYGFLERPVELDPSLSVHRLSASISYTSFANRDAGVAHTLSVAERVATGVAQGLSIMAESYWNIDGHSAVFGRVELLQKSGTELKLAEVDRNLYAVGTLAAGYAYYFGPYISLAPGIGLRGSINPMAKELESYYGSRVGYGLMAFAQLRTGALPVDR